MACELPTAVGYDLRGNESWVKQIYCAKHKIKEAKEIESSAGIKYILPAQFLFSWTLNLQNAFGQMHLGEWLSKEKIIIK